MDEHVPLDSQLPGLQRYATIVPDDPGDSRYDGVAILEFDDETTVSEAFDSEVGLRTVDDLDNFVAEVVRVAGGEIVHVE
ncbi:EthD family reductase [Saliphagus sp. GCM10025308]